MQYKKVLFLFISICVTILITGCWDALDVNNKTLVVMVITDKENDDFAFYIETPNLGQGQNQQSGAVDNRQNYFTVYAKGSSFADARRHLNAKADNPIFLGTVKALVITDELAKFGIEEYMLRMQADVQYRRALNVITSFSDPNDIVNVIPPNNVSVGESINDSIVGLKALGKVQSYTVSDILEFIRSDTSFVMINMDVENGLLTYNGYSIFLHNKLIDFIPVEESKGLVWILGDHDKRVYVVPFGDCHATIQVDLKSKSITPIYENGKLTFDLKFTFETKVMYLSKNINFKEDMQIMVNNSLQNDIANDIADAIKHSKEIKCDYLQFKDIFRMKYPNELKNINWDEIYLDAEFTISTESTLSFGSMMDFEASGDES